MQSLIDSLINKKSKIKFDIQQIYFNLILHSPEWKVDRNGTFLGKFLTGLIAGVILFNVLFKYSCCYLHIWSVSSQNHPGFSVRNKKMKYFVKCCWRQIRLSNHVLSKFSNVNSLITIHNKHCMQFLQKYSW